MTPDLLTPARGARILAGHAASGATLTGFCRHGAYLLPTKGGGEAAIRRFERIDPCRVISLRECFHPARLVERRPPGRLDNDIAAFLAVNPPEECGCDPDLAIEVSHPFPAAVVVFRLEHEVDCHRAGQPAHGTGALSGGRA